MSQDHPVARVEDIPIGDGRAHAVAGQQIAVFRLRDGRTRAVQATCPHAGGPLADGLIDDTVVICPLHNHTFDLTTGSRASRSATAVWRPTRRTARSVSTSG